jgi:hypothetical protein
MRPDTNIVGGSVRQDFDLDLRLDYTILKARVGGGKIVSYNQCCGSVNISSGSADL